MEDTSVYSFESLPNIFSPMCISASKFCEYSNYLSSVGTINFPRCTNASYLFRNAPISSIEQIVLSSDSPVNCDYIYNLNELQQAPDLPPMLSSAISAYKSSKIKDLPHSLLGHDGVYLFTLDNLYTDEFGQCENLQLIPYQDKISINIDYSKIDHHNTSVHPIQQFDDTFTLFGQLSANGKLNISIEGGSVKSLMTSYVGDTAYNDWNFDYYSNPVINNGDNYHFYLTPIADLSLTLKDIARAYDVINGIYVTNSITLSIEYGVYDGIQTERSFTGLYHTRRDTRNDCPLLNLRHSPDCVLIIKPPLSNRLILEAIGSYWDNSYKYIRPPKFKKIRLDGVAVSLAQFNQIQTCMFLEQLELVNVTITNEENINKLNEPYYQYAVGRDIYYAKINSEYHNITIIGNRSSITNVDLLVNALTDKHINNLT